ncbi:MAG: bifunctional nuclease family protein [Acidimicrobiales bacterium]
MAWPEESSESDASPEQSVDTQVESDPATSATIPPIGPGDLPEVAQRLSKMCVAEIRDVIVSLPETFGRVVLGDVLAPERILVIPVSLEQASQITVGWKGMHVARPLTHQLMHDVLGTFGLRLEFVAIVGVHEGNILAELHIAPPRGTARTIPARASDAIGLALMSRPPTPIMVADALLGAHA